MKRITRISKNRSKRIKEYLKSILRAFLSILRDLSELLVYLIVLTIKFAYRLVFKFDSIVAKIFMKLPRPTKAIIIYVLILTFVLDFTGIIQDKKIFSIKKVDNVKLAYVEPKQEERQEETIKEVKQELTCNYDEISCKIYNKAKEIGMNEEQTLISIAISRWETGNYTSKAFKEKNNVGGMMCSSELINYSSLDEGIEKFLINLKNNYFDIGLDTIEKIQKKYCPIGAKNDPNGLNKHWLGGVTNLYNELKGGE